MGDDKCAYSPGRRLILLGRATRLEHVTIKRGILPLHVTTASRNLAPFGKGNVPGFPKQGLILLERSRCEASRTSLEWETTNVHILPGVD